MSRILGIVGGMGPLASVDLQLRIIQNTLAKTDAEHLHVITDCNGKIPDRTEAILYGGESPLLEMEKSVKRLEAAGADFLTIACHTAHHFLEALQEKTSLPFISIVDTAFNEIEKQGTKKLCVLSTKGTYAIGLYTKQCEKRGIELAHLLEEEKNLLMEIIYGVKAGKLDEHTEEMKLLLKKKVEEGAEAFLLACTELPVYFRRHAFSFQIFDATDLLARELIRYGGAKVKLNL